MNKCIVYNQKPISRGKNRWHTTINEIVRHAAGDRRTGIRGDRHRRGLADRLIRAHGDRHRRGPADRLIRDHGDRRHRGLADRLIRDHGDRRRRGLADRLTGDHGELRDKITDFSLSHVRRRKNRKRMICT